MIDNDLALRLGDLTDRVSDAVARFQLGDPNPDDPFRGLYVSDEKADELINGPSRNEAPAAGQASISRPPEHSNLGIVFDQFNLVPLDIDLLVAIVAPDLESRFERLYGYLRDDLTQRRASIGLALELSGRSTLDQRARRHLASDSTLVADGLVIVEEPERPFLTRPLRLPDRVIDALLGDQSTDPALTDVLLDVDQGLAADAASVASAIATRSGLYLREAPDSGAIGSAVRGLEQAGLSGGIIVDLTRVHPDDVREIARCALREARLARGGLVVANADELHPSIIRLLTRHDAPVIMTGRKPWDPDWCDRPVHSVEIGGPTEEQQSDLWHRTIGPNHELVPPATFRLGPERIARAVATAETAAATAGQSLNQNHLVTGARAQNSAGLERLARRIEPWAGWDDIVLADETLSQLEHLTARVAHRTRVLDEWGLRRGGGRGEGVIALFAGDSGTGKTLSAEVIAKELDLEMYVIDLSTVVDKYIGETEKNLDRIFSEAEGINGILFFDEADALFGKRTDVSDARDRYANVEVAYLLQQLESFDGLGILATNLRANIDDAFARRLSVLIEFPEPNETQRLAMWQSMGGSVPMSSDVDFDYVAKAFQLTGGNIRNILVSAAYLGAAHGDAVTMADLIRAIQIEYRKLGRLSTEAEFGPYHHLLKSSEEQ